MIFEKVVKIMANELNFTEKEITLTTHLQQDLGIDSLDAVELIMTLEEEFDITIPDDAMKNLVTVADIVKLIEEYK